MQAVTGYEGRGTKGDWLAVGLGYVGDGRMAQALAERGIVVWALSFRRGRRPTEGGFDVGTPKVAKGVFGDGACCIAALACAEGFAGLLVSTHSTCEIKVALDAVVVGPVGGEGVLVVAVDGA